MLSQNEMVIALASLRQPTKAHVGRVIGQAHMTRNPLNSPLLLPAQTCQLRRDPAVLIP
jgi:hypothetical protein